MGIRSVLPYTLPGVIALIGWWWYISRKKERLSRQGSPEGAPTDATLITSPTEGSNGLVVPPINGTERSAQGSVHATNLKREHESFSYAHNQDYEAASSLRQCSEEDDTHLGQIRGEEVLKPSDLTQSLPGRDDILQVTVNDHRDAEEGSVHCLVTELEEHQLRDLASRSEGSVEVIIQPCRSNDVTSSPDIKTYLSDAERPEPEGEVAMRSKEICVCTVTPAKVQSIPPSESDTQETQHSSKDLFVTSSPDLTSVTLTSVQDSLSLSAIPEGIKIQSSGDEQDLEILVAGLVSGVISAATQEVLSVTRCQVTDGDQQGFISSTAVPCSEQEPVIAQNHHHPLTSSSPINESRGAIEKGITNGCSLTPISEPVEVSHRDLKTDSVPTEFLISSQEASQSASSLNTKLRDEADVIAEDSACSTFEEGISSEELPSSTYDHQLDVIQVTDLSVKEAERAKSLVETCTKAMDLTEIEENSMGAKPKIKLNGAGLGYKAHGTSEVEADQSGGSDVNSMDSVDSGCTMGNGDNQSNHAASLSSELVIWEIEVPKLLVGRLIGKQGRFVSYIKQNSGAKIYISTLPYTQDFQICHIEGAQQQVDKALSLISKRFKDLDLTNLYAPPLTLPSLPMTSWLLLPTGVTIEVTVVNIVSAGHVFVQQHTHPTYHALRSLDQQMSLCYSQPGTPALPSPAEVGVICAAPAGDGAWWRAQLITFYKETNEVEIRYVDYGGYDRVKIDSLRQIRSDFVTLPFQGAEVLLDNIAPLSGEDRFSPEATSALEEMTRLPLLAQVSNYDNNTGLPLVHLWNMVGEEVISVNRTFAERGLVLWVDGF